MVKLQRRGNRSWVNLICTRVERFIGRLPSIVLFSPCRHTCMQGHGMGGGDKIKQKNAAVGPCENIATVGKRRKERKTSIGYFTFHPAQPVSHVIGRSLKLLCYYCGSAWRFFRGENSRIAHQDLPANYPSLYGWAVYIGCSPGNGVCVCVGGLRQMDVQENT